MKISIITVSFNSQKTIARSIQSVLVQNKPCEYIVIDGDSQDKTVGIVNKFESYIALAVSERDNGIYDAMNKGMKCASGEIIGFLNSDDYYVDGNVLDRVDQVLDGPRFDACYGDLLYVNQRYKPVRYWKAGEYSFSKFYWGWMPPHPTFFVKRHVFERYGLFNPDFGTAADYELMLRFLVKYKISCAYIPHVLVSMRTGGASNASFAGRIRANRHDRAAWKSNDLIPYPWTLACKPLRKIRQYFLKKVVEDHGAIS